MSGQGPLQISDLLAIWTGAVDPGYSQPFLAAGDGGGLEVYNQAHAQLARVSQAIDVSTQACFILPFSGQTNPPAAGGALAQVALTFTRTQNMNVPLRFGAGSVFYDEVTNDWGTNGSVPITTGRRYTLLRDLFFMPGDMGPQTAIAVAEKTGYGFNNPLHNTISVIEQPGTQFTNSLATVTGATPDPSLLPLTAWFRAGNYNPTTGVWTGTASAGTSGSSGQFVNAAFNKPTAGAPLNGRSTVSFSRAGSQNLTNSNPILTNYISQTAFSFWALVNATTQDQNVPPGSHTPYMNDGIIADANGGVGMYLRSGGPEASVYGEDSGGNYSIPEASFANGGWQLVQGFFNGGSFQTRVNHGAWQSVAFPAGILDGSLGSLVVGSNYNASAFYDGLMADVGIAAVAFPFATFENIRLSLNKFHGLSL